MSPEVVHRSVRSRLCDEPLAAENEVAGAAGKNRVPICHRARGHTAIHFRKLGVCQAASIGHAHAAAPLIDRAPLPVSMGASAPSQVGELHHPGRPPLPAARRLFRQETEKLCLRSQPHDHGRPMVPGARRMIACGNRGMSELFRREAISHATQRLAGAVVLATPLSVRLLGLFFGSIVVAALIAVSTATYARKATVTGWLIPDQGLIRATAASAGFVQAVFVKEGQQVERGATLAELRTGADTVGGNVSEMYLGQLRAEAEATRARAQTQLERLSAESQQSSVRLA